MAYGLWVLYFHIFPHGKSIKSISLDIRWIFNWLLATHIFTAWHFSKWYSIPMFFHMGNQLKASFYISDDAMFNRFPVIPFSAVEIFSWTRKLGIKHRIWHSNKSYKLKTSYFKLLTFFSYHSKTNLSFEISHILIPIIRNISYSKLMNVKNITHKKHWLEINRSPIPSGNVMFGYMQYFNRAPG